MGRIKSVFGDTFDFTCFWTVHMLCFDVCIKIIVCKIFPKTSQKRRCLLFLFFLTSIRHMSSLFILKVISVVCIVPPSWGELVETKADVFLFVFEVSELSLACVSELVCVCSASV